MGLPAASSSTCMGRVGLRLGVGMGGSSSCGRVTIILSSERVRVNALAHYRLSCYRDELQDHRLALSTHRNRSCCQTHWEVHA